MLLAGGTALTTALAGCAGEGETSDRETGSTDGNGNGQDQTDSSDGSDDTLVELLEHEWYHDGQYSAGVQGQVENVSGETLSYVEVAVYFLDEEGVQFAEGLANTTDLAADRVWEFDATFLGDDPNRVEDYEIETTVNNY